MKKSAMVKILLLFLVALIVMIAITLHHFYYINFNIIRSCYWSIQSVGGVFTVLLPWRYAYPKCLSRCKFYTAVTIIALVNMLLFSIPNIIYKKGMLEFKILRTIFEISFMSSMFFIFPLLYAKYWSRRGSMLYFGAIPFILYGFVASVAVYWGSRVMMDYSVIGLLFWGLAVINDRKFPDIRNDYGYILMLGIVSIAVPVVLGYSMMEMIATSETLYDKFKVLCIWTCICIVLKAAWTPVASGATNPFLASTFSFPMQICVDCYDELIFGLSTWKSLDFLVVLVFRASVNFIRNSGLLSDVMEWMKSRFLAPKSEIGETLKSQMQRKLKYEFQYLEQKIVTEMMASIVVLLSTIFDKLLTSWDGDVGEDYGTINSGLKDSDVNDVIVSYLIVSFVIFLISYFAGKILSIKLRRMTYICDVENGQGTSPRPVPNTSFAKAASTAHDSNSDLDDADDGSRSIQENNEVVQNVQPVEVDKKLAVLENDVRSFDYQSSNNSVAQNDENSSFRMNHLPNLADAKCENEENLSDRNQRIAVEKWEPIRVNHVWSEFFIYYSLTALYTVFDVIFRANQIYRKTRSGNAGPGK